ISPFYDPMIAKLIVRGDDREQALARMVQALDQVISTGVHTNIAFLRRLMLDSAFATADLDTGLIERQHDTLFPSPEPATIRVLASAIAGLLPATATSVANGTQAPDAWDATDGWRLSDAYQ